MRTTTRIKPVIAISIAFLCLFVLYINTLLELPWCKYDGTMISFLVLSTLLYTTAAMAISLAITSFKQFAFLYSVIIASISFLPLSGIFIRIAIESVTWLALGPFFHRSNFVSQSSSYLNEWNHLFWLYTFYSIMLFFVTSAFSRK